MKQTLFASLSALIPLGFILAFSSSGSAPSRNLTASSVATVEYSPASISELGPEFGALSLGAVDYHLIHGEFTTSDLGAFARYQAVGNEHHVLEFGTSSSVAFEWSISDGGELYVSDDAVIVDFLDRDRIEFTSAPQDTRSFCDGAYTGVRAVTTDGGCWGPPEIDKGTGSFEQKCIADNGQECHATITFSDSELDPITPTWECGTNQNRKIYFDVPNNAAYVSNAESGC